MTCAERVLCLSIALIMPVVGRLDWISCQVPAGRLVHISIGAANDQNKICNDDGTINVASDALKFWLHATLTFLSQLASAGSAVDRGHRHSDGRYIVKIWMPFPARSSPAAFLVFGVFFVGDAFPNSSVIFVSGPCVVDGTFCIYSSD